MAWCGSVASTAKVLSIGIRLNRFAGCRSIGRKAGIRDHEKTDRMFVVARSVRPKTNIFVASTGGDGRAVVGRQTFIGGPQFLRRCCDWHCEDKHIWS